MYFGHKRDLSYNKKIFFGLTGIGIILLVWVLVTQFKLVSTGILPTPLSVLGAYKELHFENALVINVFKSVKLNFLGYLEALVIAIPFGFLIGLIPIVQNMFKKPIDSLRFIPLSAVTGLFIAWFGIGDGMKIHFLAFGIIVYLLPVVVQRIGEVNQTYLKTVYTLGATNWQTIKSVYLPSVLSKISDDIRVLVAISWTYIIIAEMINSTGGVGALIFKAARQGRIDKVFAILIIIIIIGVIQDKLFILIDRLLFKFKHLKK